MLDFGCRWNLAIRVVEIPYVSVYLYGPDFEELEDMLGEVERRLQQIPSVTSLQSDLEFGKDEIRIRVNRAQAKKHGISGRADQPHAGISTARCDIAPVSDG